MQQANCRQYLFEGSPIRLIVTWRGCVDHGLHHIAAISQRHVIQVVKRTLGDAPITAEQPSLVKAERWIDRSMPIHHELDGVLYLGCVQVERRQPLQRCDSEESSGVLART